MFDIFKCLLYINVFLIIIINNVTSINASTSQYGYGINTSRATDEMEKSLEQLKKTTTKINEKLEPYYKIYKLFGEKIQENRLFMDIYYSIEKK